MEEEGRFPYRFFVVTFAWSWLIWLPLVLAGAGIIPLGTHLLSAVTVPVTILGIFGPAAGAFYCLRASRVKVPFASTCAACWIFVLAGGRGLRPRWCLAEPPGWRGYCRSYGESRA